MARPGRPSQSWDGPGVPLHCCGTLAELIPAMIEVGLDRLHSVQPSCRGMDLARLKADSGDKILSGGPIDSGWLMGGTPDFVGAKTRDVLRIMMQVVGHVARTSHDHVLEETLLENVLAVFDAVRKYECYR